MDTILDDIPQAVQPEMCPDKKEDASQRHQLVEFPWVDEEVGTQSNQEYNRYWIPAPKATDDNLLNFKKAILLAEPKAIMVADAKGKMAPMTCAFMVVQDIQGSRNSRVLKVRV